MKKLSVALVSSLMLLSLFFTSLALATEVPLERTRLDERSSSSLTAVLTPTAVLVQPVVEAFARHFDVPTAEIAALHDNGLGFGVIARAYLLAEHLPGVPPQTLLAEFQTGRGWGQIARQYGVHPGRGQASAPGQVISAQAKDRASDTHPENQTGMSGSISPGQGKGPANAPGQNKDKSNRGQGRSGQDQDSD